MNMMVLGVSHHSAPLEVLEQVAIGPEAARHLARDLTARDEISEAAVLATCNRLEIYIAAPAFHAAVDCVSAELKRVSGLDVRAHAEHIFVRYGPDAVRHVFAVTAGLDSMALGESQILGQVRTMLQVAQEDNTAGRVLDPLLQRALHTAKRAHHETDLSHAGPSLVEAALTVAAEAVGPLGGARAVVFGAGGMSGLVVATLQRQGVADLVVVNRSISRATRLVEGTVGRCVPWSDAARVAAELACADIVFTCTGAQGHVLDDSDFPHLDGMKKQVLVDLALPRDIAPTVDALPGVTRLDLQSLGEQLSHQHEIKALQAASELVAEQTAAFLADQKTSTVGPTLKALQRRADDVVSDELGRLASRLGADWTAETEEEIRTTLRRVTNKLLHTPTVRMKSLMAGEEAAPDYATALRTLFDLEISLDAPPAQREAGEVRVHQQTS